MAQEIPALCCTLKYAVLVSWSQYHPPSPTIYTHGSRNTSSVLYTDICRIIVMVPISPSNLQPYILMAQEIPALCCTLKYAVLVS